MIKTIINEFTPEYGVCRFKDIENDLIPCRALSKIPQNAQSVITMIFPYKFDDKNYSESNISKYACVTDYHLVIGKILEEIIQKLQKHYPDNKFVYFADNSPVPEVKAAVLSGLGVKGLNQVLINPKYGSYIFIGEIVTDLISDYNSSKGLGCIGCKKCIKSCPTNALSENGVDKSRCLSDLTQKKGELNPDIVAKMIENNCIWGCDICQDVCPMNKSVLISPLKEFEHGFESQMKIDNDISDRAYAWRGRKVVERNIEIYKSKGR